MVAIKKAHKQPKAEASEVHELPFVQDVATGIQGNVDEKNLQAVQLRPSQFRLEINQLSVPVASKGNVSTSLQLTTGNKQEEVKPIRQPISLGLSSSTQKTPRITYPSNRPIDYVTQVQHHVQERKKHQRTQQLEPAQPWTDPVQQGLHTSIVQTLQNPIWQRHFSSRQQATSQLLPSTRLQLSPLQGHYQLARVQENFQPLVPILSLQTREGHRITFLQDMGYWWGMIQDNRPGFSQSSVLPVLYPQPAYMEQVGRYIQHTVEALLHAPQEVQRQLVHIFSSSKAFKNGLVYMGREMGLVGGGFWSFAGSCIGTVVSSAALGFGSFFVSGFFSGGMGPEGVAKGILWGICGAIVGCVMGVTACVEECKARLKTRNELESFDQRIQKLSKQAIQKAQNEVKQISQDPKAYKDKQKRASILKRINAYKDSVDSEILNLEQWGGRIKERNWFCHAYWLGKDDNIKEKFMWDEDFDYLKQCIQNRKEEVEKINILKHF